jgi:very-short-patch-repair endonuclease
MRDQPAKGDLVIARIAARQHGVVGVAQLRRARLDKHATSRRVGSGRLHPVHRGVYAVGHTRLTFEGRCMAAVLALGEGAVVSHLSAAALWGLVKPATGAIHVSLPHNSGRERRKGIAIHQSRTLSAVHVTRRNGIPLTNPRRTLRDLYSVSPQPVFRAAVRRALDRRLISSADLTSEADLTRSELERMMLRLCRRHRLPRPELYARIGAHEVDFLWRDRGLIVETDGFRHHGDRISFESDRARDATLQSTGFRVLRFTYRQLTETPGEAVATLRALLEPAPLFR